MTPKQTLKQINDLTAIVIELSLSNEQNYPTVYGKPDSFFEITVSTASSLAIALKNIGYSEVYSELESARCFNIKMLDGGLLSLLYRFESGTIVEHSLSYFPSPNLQLFQNEPELYLLDEVYADAVSRSIVPFPVRFDYSNDAAKFRDVDHPYSHMTLGQYKNCRIPVCSPIGPFVFGGFVLRNFYNTAFQKYSAKIPVTNIWFPKSITPSEQKVPHLVCSPI
ncbi:MAG: DUF2290 domain-containing protein [Tepidisphaeraceae bacterium]